MDLIAVYKELYRTHGPQGWWPVIGEDDEKIRAVYGIPYQSFEKYRLPWRDPFFEIAVGAIQTFSNWVVTNYHGDIRRARRRGLPALRTSLLDLWGVGFETDDDILLYALNKPI